MSAKISRYWTNFAKTGDPNDGNLPHWPVFIDDSGGIRNTMVFSFEVRTCVISYVHKDMPVIVQIANCEY